MPRVLFVDDEPNILNGLRRRTRRLDGVWDMAFASGADEALAIMANAPADVIVTDTKMPGTSGAELLACVEAGHPGTIRVVLSGQSDLDDGVRAISLSHRYLGKPIANDDLIAVLGEALSARALLHDERVARAISALDHIPGPPSAIAQQTPGDIDALITAVKHDPALAFKTLHVANSALFAPARPILDLGEAVRFVGADAIVAIARAGARKAYQPPPGWRYDRAARHARAVAALSAAIAADQGAKPGEVGAHYAAGLVHDIGRHAMAGALGAEYGAVLAAAAQTRLDVAEREWLGADHAQVGAFLAGLWGLPPALILAINAHHRRPSPDDTSMPAIIHVADALVHETGLGPHDMNAPGATDTRRASEADHPLIDRWRPIARDFKESR